MYPKEKRYGRYAAVFEMKKELEGELEKSAEEALMQIRERKYLEKMMIGYGMIVFGIAFEEKRVKVVARRFEEGPGDRL